MTIVTDPALLAQLNAPDIPGSKKVTDLAATLATGASKRPVIDKR